jgi:hypothetical protein
VKVTVDPPTFSIVDYEAARIAAVATEVAGLVGLPDDVRIDIAVDERNPFGKVSAAVHGRSVEIFVEGGAFEDPRQLRRFSEPNTRLVLGRLLYRIADRLDPAFGEPPTDAELTPAEHTAWDTYAVGRWSRRTGVDEGQARRRYAFRLRCGFTDAADRAFDRLWVGDHLSWEDVRNAVTR